ncbi:MAG: hypothetical protein WCB04_00755 [Mycobacteriales bacterium]
MHPAYEDDALRNLTSADRAALSQRLGVVVRELDAGVSGGDEARELFITVTAFASLLLIPWIIALAALLPATHSVSHWRATWVGFDIVLALALATTAWLAFVRRQTVVLAAFITGTLLACDAWFDVLSSAAGWDRLFSWGSAVLEIALAGVMFNTVRLYVHFSAHRAQTPSPGRVVDLLGGSRGDLQGLPANAAHLSLPRVVRRSLRRERSSAGERQ